MSEPHSVDSSHVPTRSPGRSALRAIQRSQRKLDQIIEDEDPWQHGEQREVSGENLKAARNVSDSAGADPWFQGGDQVEGCHCGTAAAIGPLGTPTAAGVARRITKDALVPPNAKALTMTVLTSRSRARSGT